MLRRLITFFFLFFVFSSTFSISISQTAIGIATVLFVAAAIRERFNPFGGNLRWFWGAVVAYVGWLIIVCLLQDDPVRALNYIREEWLFVIVPVGIYLMRDNRTFEHVVKALAIGLLLISVGSLLMYGLGLKYHWPEGFSPLSYSDLRMQGNFANALTFGNIAAVASLSVLTWALTQPGRLSGWRAIYLISGFLGLVGVLFCGSRGPLLAALAGLIVLLFYLVRGARRWGWAVLVAVLLIGLLTPSVRSRFTTELGWHFNRDWPGGRLFIWERSLDMVAGHLLTGIGPGNFPREYKDRLDPQVTSRYWYQHAHNDFLEAATRSGVPGAVTFIGLWVAFFYSIRARFRRAVMGSQERRVLLLSLIGAVVFLVGSLTEASFSDEEVRAVLMFVWASGLAVAYNNQESARSGRTTVS